MTHYKSNLRDIEFNLFEVLADRANGHGTVRGHRRRDRQGLPEEHRRAGHRPALETFASADRNPPVYDPATYSVKMPGTSRPPTRH